MYGVPKDLQLERLVGHEFNFIGLGTWQIQFHISSLVAIHVEGRWELRDSSGTIVDSAQEPPDRDSYRIYRIIDVPIVRFTLDAPRSFTLFFESGHSLTSTTSPSSMSLSPFIFPASRASTFSSARLSQFDRTPNQALQRTGCAVTAHAPTAFAPAAFPHGPRLLRLSLSLGSLGVATRIL